MTRISFRAALVASSITTLISNTAAQSPPSLTVPASSVQTLDCYKDAGGLKDQGSWTFQSSGYCQIICANQHLPVMATTGGSNCLCGESLPPTSDKVSGDNCNTPCQGYNTQDCGGTNYFQVYLSGIGAPEDSSDEGSSASSTSSTPSQTSAHPSVVTQKGQTVVVTASSAPENSPSHSSGGGGGPSKVAIAVGVVVGVVGVAAIVGGAILFLKRRRRLAIEEDHRRNAAVNSFVNGPKSETSSTDQRLDPTAFAARRQSVGSIADERDFTRRILQVRNPDRESKASNLA